MIARDVCRRTARARRKLVARWLLLGLVAESAAQEMLVSALLLRLAAIFESSRQCFGIGSGVLLVGRIVALLVEIMELRQGPGGSHLLAALMRASWMSVILDWLNREGIGLFEPETQSSRWRPCAASSKLKSTSDMRRFGMDR